jgi:hypothetical protein
MSTRAVRGESGAIFEVDASMVDVPPEGGYRTSGAPPPAHAIRPAPPSTLWSQERVAAVTLSVLVLAIVLVALSR